MSGNDIAELVVLALILTWLTFAISSLKKFMDHNK